MRRINNILLLLAIAVPLGTGGLLGKEASARSDAAVSEELVEHLFPEHEKLSQRERYLGIEELMDRLFPQEKEQTEQLKHMKIEFSGPPKRPAIYEVLVVTKRSNPMLTENCRREAAQHTVAALSGTENIGEKEAARLLANHVSEAQAMVTEKGLSYADYLKHVVECRNFCRPVVSHLINCHVLAVSNQEHGIVLFDYDSDAVKTPFVEGVIEAVAERLESDPSMHVLLIGRASRTGELRYNRLLSGRRALAVKDKLMEKGAEPSRIQSMWFGWEEPQIDRWIAKEYGLEREFLELDKRQMNQSVVMVLY